MQEFDAGVRDLHERVERLDGLLHERTTIADLTDKRADAAHATAEDTRRRQRWIVAVIAAGMLVWSPTVAYAAVYGHELVRNNCYPGVALMEPPGGWLPAYAVDQPWYCGLFPGTRPRHN
jgi:hypothetical protein